MGSVEEIQPLPIIVSGSNGCNTLSVRERTFSKRENLAPVRVSKNCQTPELSDCRVFTRTDCFLAVLDKKMKDVNGYLMNFQCCFGSP